MRRRAWIAVAAAVAATLCACTAGGQKDQSDWEYLDLTGEVQQVISRVYGAVLGPDDLQLISYTITAFERDGRLVDERYFNTENQLTGYRSLKRGRDGRVAEELYWSAAGELESRVAYTYDRQGRLESEAWCGPDGTRSGGYSYEYDAQGRLARRLMDASYSDGSRRSNEARYGYDAAGRLVEETYHDDSLGGLALRITYAYEGGRRAYRSDYQRGRWLEFRSFFRYDDKGNVVEEVAYQIPESEDSTVYESLTRPERFPRRLLSSRRVWEYTYFQGGSP